MAGKSVSKAGKAAIVLGEVKGGAAYAQHVIDRLRADPAGDQLESWVGYAEHGGFNGNEDELAAFYATLQAAILATPAKLSESDRQQIGSDVGRVSSLILSMLQISRNMDANEAAAIEALCEKAGTIADRCAVALGDIATYGSWEEWAAQPRAQETSHG